MHIAKARTLLPPSEVPYHLPSEISISTPTSSEQDPIQIAKSELADAAWFTVGHPERRHATWHLDYVLKDLSMKMGSFCAYDIELVDSRNVSIGNSYSPSVSPFRLVLDQIIQFCCEIPLDGGLTFDDYSHTFFDTLRRPLLALQDQISREALTYISLMLAAVCRCLKRRSTSTPAEEQRLKSLILKGFYNIHKGEAVADDVILAFSFIPIRDDIDQVGFDVFRVLFLASWWMLAVEYRQNKITEPNFPKALLRLAREHRHDFQLSFNIAHLVERCVDGDWASPLQDSEYADDIIHLLKCSLSPKTGLQRLPPTTELLDMISRMSDRDHFLQVIDLLFGSHNIHKLLSWKHMEADYRFWRGDLEFVRRVMQLPKHDGVRASVLLESQIWLAVGILPYPTIPWSSQSDLAVEFLNRVLKEEEDLHWPGYLISAGILPPTHNNALAGSRTLKFIEVETLKSYWELDPVDIFTPLPINGPIRAIWFGEAVLMLWKTAKLEIARETLPQNWNNGVFFENWMPGAMMRYYRSVCNKGYSGVDWQILREYFNAYLAESSQPRQQMESGSPVAGSEGVPDINPSLSDDAMELAETRRQITEVLAELDGLVSKGSIASNPAEDEK
ncbi:hypothetical protein FRC03_011634 [Tulasnella sp. 419]|nr:hypothetical protein FRC03_011634 [Tulasnella sp. 419]